MSLRTCAEMMNRTAMAAHPPSRLIIPIFALILVGYVAYHPPSISHKSLQAPTRVALHSVTPCGIRWGTKGSRRGGRVQLSAKKEEKKGNIGEMMFQSDKGGYEMPKEVMEKMKANAERRLKDLADKSPTGEDIFTEEGFNKMKEDLKKDAAEILNKSFDEAKAAAKAELAAKMEELDKERERIKQRNVETAERLKKEDEEQLKKLYDELIVPMKKDRDAAAKTVSEMAEIENSSSGNEGLFFKNLYGGKPKKDKVLRPQSSEDGKLQFLEKSASDPKTLGKATRDAIEDLKAEKERQAQPFIRSAYALITSIIIVNGIKWLSIHNPFGGN